MCLCVSLLEPYHCFPSKDICLCLGWIATMFHTAPALMLAARPLPSQPWLRCSFLWLWECLDLAPSARDMETHPCLRSFFFIFRWVQTQLLVFQLPGGVSGLIQKGIWIHWDTGRAGPGSAGALPWASMCFRAAVGEQRHNCSQNAASCPFLTCCVTDLQWFPNSKL